MAKTGSEALESGGMLHASKSLPLETLVLQQTSPRLNKSNVIMRNAAFSLKV